MFFEETRQFCNSCQYLSSFSNVSRILSKHIAGIGLPLEYEENNDKDIKFIHCGREEYITQ